MSRHTPLAFSLPSQQAGETDATGLCTIRLLEEMQNTHNSIIERLRKHDQTRPFTTLKTAPGAEKGKYGTRPAVAPGVRNSPASGDEPAPEEPEPEQD
eukprot:SAG31_NODE_25431_length_461_cov_1.422652_1_plen_97_part_01